MFCVVPKKNLLPRACISMSANCSRGKVRAAIRCWAPKWKKLARRLCQLTWLPESVFAGFRVEPPETDDGFSCDDSFVCLDGKVFPTQESRKSSILNRASYSSKTDTCGSQALVWSMQTGTPFLATWLYAARLSEKLHVALHSPWLRGIPSSVGVLKDRGLRGLQRFYPNRNTIIIPVACSWNYQHQMDFDEYTCSLAQARRRWVSENVFERELNSPSLAGFIPYQYFSYVDCAHMVGVLNVLLAKFALEPRDWSKVLEYRKQKRK